jgi:hypothetical protein
MRRRQIIRQPQRDALLARAQDLQFAESDVEGGAVQDLLAGLSLVEGRGAL